MLTTEARREFETIVGSEHLLTEPEELLAYECDGLTFHRALPECVALPGTGNEAARLIAAACRHGLPVVARGAGTGLSGGALAVEGGLVVEFSRMKNTGAIDERNGTIRVEPGVINSEVTRLAAGRGFFYAPDPSSQGACTIGGNVAENSGGPHCLKYGTTVNYIRELTVALGDGQTVVLGSAAADAPGYDLCGVFVGSEGTLGMAVSVLLRLTRAMPAVRTLLAAYDGVEDATRSVSGIVASGIIPVALEMMDHVIIQAVEDSVYRAGYPRDAGAVLVIELEGLETALSVQEAKIREICLSQGCREIRVARDAAERGALWAGRKGAFGACGRLKPSMYLSDTVVPRDRLAAVLAQVNSIAADHGIMVANVFHAGDGNLHPILLYDEKNPEETARMLAACGRIMEACVAAGGCLSGEHGIGMDKRDYMRRQFRAEDLEAMRRVKRAFDPGGRCNPGKLLPD